MLIESGKPGVDNLSDYALQTLVVVYEKLVEELDDQILSG